MNNKCFIHINLKNSSLIKAIIGLCLCLSCQEPYEVQNLENKEQILVVNGTITNGYDSCNIQLAWASAFNESSTEYISNALVALIDTTGHTEILTPMGDGWYSTSPTGMVRQIKDKYKLRIEFDGQIYETPFEEIPEPVHLNNITAEYKEKIDVGYNLYGQIASSKITGIEIVHTMENKLNEPKYFRYSFVVLGQYLTVIEASAGTIFIYSWNIWPSKSSIKFGSLSLEQFVKNLNNFDGLFLVYRNEVGWVIETSTYTLNESAFKFYKAVMAQINAENKIFDPIPSQILGNVICITDASKKVFGLVEFASKTVDYNALYWNGISKTDFKYADLPNYSMPDSNGSKRDTMPDFYINFKNIPY